MRKFFAKFFGQSAKSLEKEKQEFVSQSETEKVPNVIPENEVTFLTPSEEIKPEQKPNNKIIEQRRKKLQKKTSTDIIELNPRDVMEIMEVPFLALSKKRKKPIIYESKDGKTRIKISAHSEHYVASIYDWDIILFVSAKMQEVINSGSDIPPKTLIIPRHELLKSIHRHSVTKQKEDLELSLNRLQLTLIETTIRNEDYRYRGGFSFLDSWRYTERKDIKEFRITLSDWLYEMACSKGSLLKVDPEYFKITSGLKRFLYRTARKHVGSKNSRWEFSAKTLYNRSGSEREFKKFKHDLKKAVVDNDLPRYSMEWIGEDEREKVGFINKEMIEKLCSITHEPNENQESPTLFQHDP